MNRSTPGGRASAAPVSGWYQQFSAWPVLTGRMQGVGHERDPRSVPVPRPDGRQLELDLAGPGGGPDEVLDELPLDRYICGVLWPSSESGSNEMPDEPDDAGADEDGAVDDSPVAQARIRYPSSAGLTFSVGQSLADTVLIQVNAARYVAANDGTADDPGEADQISRRSSDQRAERWRREAVVAPPIRQSIERRSVENHSIAPGLELYVYVRAREGRTPRSPRSCETPKSRKRVSATASRGSRRPLRSRPPGPRSSSPAPAEAFRAGATHIVVGRPITAAKDPAAAARAIQQEIGAATAETSNASSAHLTSAH